MTAFSVEKVSDCIYDYLDIDGALFCGVSGPQGVTVASGTIEWVSASIQTDSGWELCWLHSPPLSPLTPPSLPRPPEPPAPPSQPPTYLEILGSGACRNDNGQQAWQPGATRCNLPGASFRLPRPVLHAGVRLLLVRRIRPLRLIREIF
eukprot:266799-Prymnesium_polylepis.1